MTRQEMNECQFMPLYHHHIRFIQPHTIVEAEKFQQAHPTPDTLHTVGERLRWYRYQRGYLQRDVAKAVGVYRTTYARYEAGEVSRYPVDVMERLAEYLEVTVEDLL